eukprot:1523820-Amphidinium_carterae.1
MIAGTPPYPGKDKNKMLWMDRPRSCLSSQQVSIISLGSRLGFRPHSTMPCSPSKYPHVEVLSADGHHSLWPWGGLTIRANIHHDPLVSHILGVVVPQDVCMFQFSS